MAAKQDEEIRGLHRLCDEQVKALDDTKLVKEKWEKYRSDYQALKKKLQTLPDKLTHDVMVPFGPLAFMRGKLIHSNEIMVLLGEDWFAERSAKQACQIVDRRVKAIDNQLNDVQEQWKLLEARKEFTDQFLDAAEAHGDFVEIKEHYDEDEEQTWRDTHKRSLIEERKRKIDETTTELDADLMKRLDELEILEQEEEERGEDFDDNGTNAVNNRDDDSSECSDEEEDSSKGSDKEEEDGSESEEGVATRVIRFKHTHIAGTTSSSDIVNGDDRSTRDQSLCAVQSPADIYRIYGTVKEPKSILKKSMSTDSANRVRFEDTREETDIGLRVSEMKTSREQHVAFSGEVIERNVETVEKQFSAQEPEKRVSRFKQQRMQQAENRR